MIELTTQQRNEIHGHLDDVVEVTNPETKEEFVLVRKELYERIKTLLYDDSTANHEELRLMLARSSAANGWDEPEMDEYDDYDAYRRK